MKTDGAWEYFKERLREAARNGASQRRRFLAYTPSEKDSRKLVNVHC